MSGEIESTETNLSKLSEPPNSTESKQHYIKPNLQEYGNLRDLTLAGGAPPTNDSPGTKTVASDVRLKRDVVALGKFKGAINLYQFRYLWDEEVYVGVMAQEVIAQDPSAVTCGNDGFLRVNYERLGMKFMTKGEWCSTKDAPAKTN